MANALFRTLTGLVAVATVVPLPCGAVAVSVDWADTLNEIGVHAFSLNGFKATYPTVTSDSVYLSRMRYMLGDRDGGGFIRIHTWEMMGEESGAGSWMGSDNGWNAQKAQDAVRPLVEAGFNVMINIPATPGDADVSDAAAFAAACSSLVAIINVDGGLGVTLWEIPNERDDVFLDDPQSLIDLYNAAAQAMKAVDATIQVGGPAFQYPHKADDVKAFIDGTLANLDFCSFHNYAGGGDMPDANVWDNAGAQWYCEYISAYLAQASPDRHIPLWYDEFNVSWTWEAGQAQMNGMCGAIYDALTLSRALDFGADVLAAWNEMDGSYGKMDNSYNFRPAAHVFHLFNSFVYGRRAATSTGDAAVLVPYASFDSQGGRRTLVVTNRTTSNQTLTVTSAGWTAQESLQTHQLTSSGLTQEQDVEPAALENGIELPPESVTLFTHEPETNTAGPMVGGDGRTPHARGAGGRAPEAARWYTLLGARIPGAPMRTNRTESVGVYVEQTPGVGGRVRRVVTVE